MDIYQKQIASLFSAPDDMSVEDCVHTFADPAQVLLAYSVFNPQFTEIEGEPVLGALSEAQLISAKEALKIQPASKALESYRWLEIPYLFSNRSSLTEAQDHLLAQLMVSSWQAKLAYEYPDKNWQVKILSPETSGSVVSVAFNEI